MGNEKPQRRTMQERVEAIFEFIDAKPGIFPKSQLSEIGLNPKAAEKWLMLIEYIQSQPKIRVTRSEHTTLVEKVEGKYQALMRKMIIDDTLSFEQREKLSSDYLKSLYARERVLEEEKS